eukprot:GILI01009880.1.p1 GENE.GILI01009880.1~~GILI01009880.1.p1  ORF type:complete len:314 (+),score=120.37 GILI01009880.1:138-1079(+)
MAVVGKRGEGLEMEGKEVIRDACVDAMKKEEKKKKKKEEIVHITADGAANLRVTRMKWADNSNDQMHNKFMLVSRTCSSSHVVLVATANMDAKKHKLDWHQTAIAVYNHDGLYHAYLQYMEVIAAHKEAIAPFRKHMHKNPIDYKDEHFQAYFYPTHDIRDTSRNVLFHLIDQVEAGESQNARLSVNMAFFKKDVFGEALVSKLTAAKEKAASCGKNFTIVSSIMEEGELGPFPDFDGKLAQACTHSKDYTFAFLDLQEFYSITGSTNCKENDYAKKANTMLVVREVGESHPVYDVFEAIHRSIPAGGNSEGH